MLNFLAGLGKDKAMDDVEIESAPLEEFDLEEFDIELSLAPEKDQMHRSLFRTEVENLMNSVKQQSVDISCQFATFANWSSEIETLSARAATLQPLLTKLVEENSSQAAALAELTRSKDAVDHRMSGLETEVAHYRPLAARLEEELLIVKEKHASAQSMLSSLEGQFAQHQSENNDLIYALAKAESKATRAGEENLALRQKALEHNAVIQSQMREVADIKSSISTKSRELQKQEELVADLSAKLAASQESGNHSASTLSAVLMREAQMEKDLQKRMAEAAEHQQDLMQKLANRDKHLNVAEVKIAGLNSKVEFLTQLTQKLRDELRNDHASMIENSNRQMVESISQPEAADEKRVESMALAKELAAAKDLRPKLRTIPMANAARLHAETPMREQRAS